MGFISEHPEITFWIVALVIALIAEGVTLTTLVSLWFIPGIVIALILAACNVPFYIQVSVFMICTVASLFLTKPFIKKYVNGKTKSTNFDRILGQNAIVTEEIDNIKGNGAVQVDGKTWTARSVENEIIPVGELVKVESIEGVKAMVKHSQSTSVN